MEWVLYQNECGMWILSSGDANMSYYNHVPERVIQAASMIRKHKNNDGNHNDNKNKG